MHAAGLACQPDDIVSSNQSLSILHVAMTDSKNALL